MLHRRTLANSSPVAMSDSESENESVLLFNKAPALPVSAAKPAQKPQQITRTATAGADRSTFAALGLKKWLCDGVEALGIHKPSPVQASCVPAVLAGNDVLGSARTGSGKLSEDPFGIFALVLTPSRELAYQIAEQFLAFGAHMNVRTAIVVGGEDMIKQTDALQKRPHIVIATPGRLADLMTRSAMPPRLSALQFLVLDEADRMLDSSFAPDLEVILKGVPSSRQTLCFSATLTSNLERVKALALTDPYEFVEGDQETTADNLKEQYVFMPAQVKHVYLAYIMRRFGPESELTKQAAAAGNKATGETELERRIKRAKDTARREAEEEDELAARGEDEDDYRRAKSVIIFTATVRGCQMVCEMLQELAILTVALHSNMSQRRRLATLGKFKSGLVSVLVATDVASRGLDIPEVDLVINFDIPRIPDDYIHRVGRTARAGRGGRSISLLTQYDVELIQAIEAHTGKTLTEAPGLSEEEVLKGLNEVTTAQRVARMRMAETGFDAALEQKKERKMESKARQAAFLADGEDGGTADAGAASDTATTAAAPAAMSGSATPAKKAHSTSGKQSRKGGATSGKKGKGATPQKGHASAKKALMGAKTDTSGAAKRKRGSAGSASPSQKSGKSTPGQAKRTAR